MGKKFVLYGLAAVLGILCAVVLSGFFMITTVAGSGMEPALSSGDHVLIAKRAYCGKMPQAGQIVAFACDVYGEEGEGRLLVRRVAGEPGDLLEIKEGVFYRNGKPYEDYMREAVRMEDMSQIKLGEDQFFVLSDNRKSVMDSRNEAIGVLELKDCLGKVCFGQKGTGKESKT